MKKSSKKIEDALYSFYESITNNEKHLEDMEIKLLGWETAARIYTDKLNQIRQRGMSEISNHEEASDGLELSGMLCSAQQKAAVLAKKRFKLSLVVAKSRVTEEKILKLLRDQGQEAILHE